MVADTALRNRDRDTDTSPTFALCQRMRFSASRNPVVLAEIPSGAERAFLVGRQRERVRSAACGRFGCERRTDDFDALAVLR